MSTADKAVSAAREALRNAEMHLASVASWIGQTGEIPLSESGRLDVSECECLKGSVERKLGRLRHTKAVQ